MKNIKYPILFLSKKELQEAKEYGIMDFKSIDSSFDYPYMLTCYEGGQNFNTWKKESILLAVQDASFWNDVREDYLPKYQWHDFENKNGGKIVWVRNSLDKTWSVDIFRRYVATLTNPFLCESNSWLYAKPVTQANIIGEEAEDD